MVLQVVCRRWDFQLCGGPVKSSVTLQDSSALNTPILKGPYIAEALQHASLMVPDPEEMQL